MLFNMIQTDKYTIKCATAGVDKMEITNAFSTFRIISYLSLRGDITLLFVSEILYLLLMLLF